jgi:hypothetical protein
MLIWINGAFGAGKTTVAYELRRRLPGSWVYDPENLGFFLRKNFPPPLGPEDFQDAPLWREGNFLVLRALLEGFEGTVLAPMTMVSPRYYEEIVGRLARAGFEVRHVVLELSREALGRRLRARELKHTLRGRESWAARQMDRCLAGLAALPGERVDALAPPNRVAEAIAERCGLTLAPDARPEIVRRLGYLATSLKHIR